MPEYGETGPPSAYQEDHLISLELGGSPTDPSNLWPEPYPRAADVDKIENELNDKVCSGELTLAEAQRRRVRAQARARVRPVRLADARVASPRRGPGRTRLPRRRRRRSRRRASTTTPRKDSGVVGWFYPTMGGEGLQEARSRSAGTRPRRPRSRTRTRSLARSRRRRRTASRSSSTSIPLHSLAFTDGAKCAPSTDPKAAATRAQIGVRRVGGARSPPRFRPSTSSWS